MDVLYDDNGKRYEPEIVLKNLREMWRVQGQLSYPDFKLLWEIVDHMQATLNESLLKTVNRRGLDPVDDRE